MILKTFLLLPFFLVALAVFSTNALAQNCVSLGGSNPTSHTENFDSGQSNGRNGLTGTPAPQQTDASNIFQLNANNPRRFLGKFDDAVADTTNAIVRVPGFAIVEEGSSTSASGRYGADDGTSATGNVYSLGTTATERALGSLNAVDIDLIYLGACFRNTGSSPITSVLITFKGEQWRVGGSGTSDRLDFQYSTDATNVYAGTYVDFNALDFVSLVTTGGAGSKLDGNAVANNQRFTATITGLNIPVNNNFYVRWRDADKVLASDDELAIDDFGISFAPPTAVTVSVSGRVTNASGGGIHRARLTAVGASGETQTVLTNSFGYYRFSNVPVNQLYVINVSSKKHLFDLNSQVLNLTSDREDIDFVGSN